MRYTTPLIAGVLLALAGGPAGAYEPENESGASEKTVLGGPRVDARPGDAGRPDDAPENAMDETMRAERVEPPFTMYLMHLRSLQRGEDESLRLTDEQTESIRAIAQEHRESVREYLMEHREEIRRLREVSGERPGWAAGRRANDRDNARPIGRPDARPARGGEAEEDARPAREDAGERPERARERVRARDGMQPVERNNTDRPDATPEQRAEARDRLFKLLGAAPGDKESREKLLGVLTEAQRERVEAAVATRMAAGGPDDRPDARPGQRGDERPGARRPGARPDDAERPARRAVQRRQGRPGGDGG